MPNPGKVYLVGAGPGSLAYLTVSARQLLAEADVLVYDALVDLSLLQQVSPTCEQIHVGKRGGQPSTPQAEINRCLVEQCLQGKTVVRLKSGDPFIFGRTAAEIQALQAARCAFEIIPGISSALAAPLLAGIPLTDPVLSRGFGVFTVHDLDGLDWSALSRLETLVLLMGGRRLPEICQRLQQHGQRGEMPVAVIRWASQPQQQVWQGTLLSISQQTRGARLSPCIIVIGEVVRLREYLQPAVRAMQPLKYKTILVTRAASQSSRFTDLLTAQGAAVIDLPALEIRPPTSWEPMDNAIAALPSFDWLILTSANAVTFFLDRLLAAGGDLRSLAQLKIAVVGQKTATVLRQRGLTPDFIPPEYVADSLVAHFPAAGGLKGLRLLFPRVESGGRTVLVDEMAAQGATVVEVPAYESVCPAHLTAAGEAALAQNQADAISFASSKTVRHFAQLMQQAFGRDWLGRLDGVAIASIGPQTSQACEQQLGRVDIEAAEYTLEGLTQAIVEWADGSSA
ncbi:uroporphyrinogen-III C-methyltransferase [Romeria aff. gracilis LEGE 07310]|uniref:uroporphyrinogen-III C-methyltransferase n=1 Tax=Vasconcelosia minhoensis LEGE 07310 TaxID=915328 RepID=A0A8J7DSA3_9CYAN|nr:uroporphyrinogen-III C-methyltransferase [Romeria gracilis]MBE9079894.1 uroporphyrinogen-III C-methyltransferase [Romeria aff. gracilis LEGE 07310]